MSLHATSRSDAQLDGEPVKSRRRPNARRFDVPSRAWGSTAVVLFAAVLGGCGVNLGGGFVPNVPPLVAFIYWDSLSVTSCRGWLNNFGGHAASNARVQLWYATAQGETSRVVLVGNLGGAGGQAPFFATPQLTGGEPRFPRVGVVSWNGGSTPEDPRAPKLRFSEYNTGGCENCRPRWCWTSPDSLIGMVYNSGGLAYHVAMTLENRDGVRDFAPPLGRIPAKNGDWSIYSAPRESSGIRLPPRIQKIRWEDYGGIRDSLISPPVDTTTCRWY